MIGVYNFIAYLECVHKEPKQCKRVGVERQDGIRLGATSITDFGL